MSDGTMILDIKIQNSISKKADLFFNLYRKLNSKDNVYILMYKEGLYIFQNIEQLNDSDSETLSSQVLRFKWAFFDFHKVGNISKPMFFEISDERWFAFKVLQKQGLRMVDI